MAHYAKHSRPINITHYLVEETLFEVPYYSYYRAFGCWSAAAKIDDKVLTSVTHLEDSWAVLLMLGTVTEILPSREHFWDIWAIYLIKLDYLTADSDEIDQIDQIYLKMGDFGFLSYLKPGYPGKLCRNPSKIKTLRYLTSDLVRGKRSDCERLSGLENTGRITK
ncbi:hypothetical protein B0H19DRAFT_1060320 [Mycena capillaripes]|nr:hypothetical protein B0H19DRAFT_1060320 [Mycena capillaripes]